MPTDSALATLIERQSDALGLSLTAGQQDALLRYVGLLHKWNATYNLTAIRDPAQMVVQHLGDSLSVVEPLRQYSKLAHVATILDAGSGAGLPGVILAVVFPQTEVLCVDSVRKKTSFVSQVASELKISNLHSVHARLEQMASAQFDLIATRAFASLPDMISATRHLLAPGGAWMAMKGKSPHEELRNMPSDIEVFHVEQVAVPGLDAERCLVWMRRK